MKALIVGVGLLWCSAVAADGKAVAGKVSFLQGGVFRGEKEDGPYKKLSDDSEIFEGDFLKTDADSRLEARLMDRSVLRLGSAARMRVEKAAFQKGDEAPKQVSLKLFAGRMWAKVTKLFGDDSSFNIVTPNAVAGVRGTAFGVDQNKDKSTSVRVFSGKVAVSNKPSYMVEGTKKFDGTQKPGERKQVAGPQEISKKQYEELMAQALQQIRVASNGQMDKPQAFAVADAEKDEWVAWNRGRDTKEPGE